MKHEDHNERINLSPAQVQEGFAEVMDRFDTLEPKAQQHLRQRTEAAIEGHKAYAQAHAYLEQGDTEAARSLLQEAARHNVPGAEDDLSRLAASENADVAARKSQAATVQSEGHTLQAHPSLITEHQGAPDDVGSAVAETSRPQEPPATTQAPTNMTANQRRTTTKRRTGAAAPNRQLAALIAEAGFSHAGLARRVDQLGLEHGLDLKYNKTSVTRWLRGQQPRGSTPALIAEVFTRRLGRRLTAQDLGLDARAPVYAGLEFAATSEEAVDIVSGLWHKDTGSPAELRKIAFTPAGLVVPSRDWLIGRADAKVARGVGSSAGQQRGQAERGHGQQVTSGDIAALRSVSELFRMLDDMHGGGHARHALVRYLEHECTPMLRGTYGELTGRQLFAAAADLTRLAGWTSYDIAAHGLAQRYFVQALRLAQAAGDRTYGSWVLVTMSRQAVYLGHGREAVQLARVAQQGAGGSAPPVVQALLHATEARGHGVLGEVRACTASMLRAERALEAARPGDETPHWARSFDEAELADEFGHCHRDLQQFRSAAQHADHSLQLRAPRYARSRLFSRIVLATAHLGLGDLELACQLGAEAAGQAVEMRSVRAIEYVKDFERRLEPYRDAAVVRDYHYAADVDAYRRQSSAG